MKKSNTIRIFSALAAVFTLASCNNSNIDTPTTPNHVHTFDTTISKDDTYHWYNSTCNHEETVVKQKHTFNEGTIVKFPTENEAGTKTFVCKDCGYVKEETIEKVAHTHKFEGKWTVDENHHYHASACGHDDTVVKENHDFTIGVITTFPTEENDGVKTYTCKVCQYKKTEAISKLAHTHKFDSAWTSDENYHYHASTCGHDDAVTKYEHTYGLGVDGKVVNGIYETTYTCVICGHTKITKTDARVYESKNWMQVGDPKSYYFENDAIYSLNKENIGKDKEHFIFDGHDYLINKQELGANYTVSVDLKGTYESDVDVEMDAGLVAYYLDNDNYVVIGVKWANWDRPHEIRSIFMNAKINGKTSSADIWTDNSGSYPADGATLTVTKTGKKYDVSLTNCYGGYSKSGNFTINGTDTKTAKAGLYAANDLVEFKNYNASSFEVSTITNYNAKIDGVSYVLSLDSKDNTFTLKYDKTTLTGTYSANGRNITLKFADNSLKYAKVYDSNNTFEFYIPENADENAIVVDGTNGKKSQVVKENIIGDYTMEFNYLGTLAEAGHSLKVGFDAYYIDENNYIEVYIEWSAGDRGHEIRCIQITGKVNGEHVGWNDIWCDGSNRLVADGGKLTITKTNKTFTAKLVSGSFTKEGSATINALDTSKAYSTRFYAEGDKISFSKVNIYQDISNDYNVSGDGAESAILRDTGIVLNNAKAISKTTLNGDYTITFDYIGTLAEAGHSLKVGFMAYYIDENNYIEVYVEWSAGDRGHEIRCIQITGHIDGNHVGWNDIWCDGSNRLVADGGKLTITKTNKTFTAKLVSGSFTKEGSATINALDTSKAYSTGFYSENDTITFKNISLTK